MLSAMRMQLIRMSVATNGYLKLYVNKIQTLCVYI